jgi:biotin carboxyl carrier protein
MSSSSSPSTAGNSGWEVIDEALDGIHRAAFQATEPQEFHAALTRFLRPVGVLHWSLWQLNAAQWHRTAHSGSALSGSALSGSVDSGSADLAAETSSSAAAASPLSEHVLAERSLAAAAWEAKAARIATSSGPQAATTASSSLPPRIAVAAPFGLDDLVGGVFIICRERPAQGPATQGFTRLTEAVAEEVRVFEIRRALRESRQMHTRHSRLDPLLAKLHESLSLNSTAHVLVNETRTIIECDRVAVSLSAGRSQRLEAISGSEQPHRQSAVLERLEPLCAAVAAIGEPLWLGSQRTEAESDEEHPPELLSLWDAFREVSPSRSLVIWPLCLSTPSLDAVAEPTTVVIGTLVCERFDRAFDASTKTLMVRLAPHAAVALANARVVSRFPGNRLWWRWAHRGLGGERQFWRRALSVVASIAAVALSLLLIPAELEVRAAGEVRSVARREVFAPADGIVDELLVEHGQLVAANALLLVVSSPDLDRQWQEARGAVDSLQRQLASIQSQRLQARAGDAATRQRAATLAAEEEQLQAQRKSRSEQLMLLESRRESLRVRSPIAGRIVSWGVRDRLAGRPLRRGDPLMTVAGDGGPFELELRVPERVAGRVLASATSAEGGQRVSWTLASRPESVRRGMVCELARRFEYDDWGGGFLRVRVALPNEAAETTPREIGEVVAAKIACGRVSLAESWFFELIDTARRWWWL